MSQDLWGIRWERLLPGHQDVMSALLSRYTEPARSYHNLDHLRHVLDVVDDLRAEASGIDAVELAAWFHDAVYDVHRRDNEEQSATLACDTLTSCGVALQLAEEVARLVRVTALHDPGPADRNGAVLSDADLAILAADPPDYSSYAAKIREEYHHLDEDVFAAGRAAVLRRLLDRPSIFITAQARRRWESTARANMVAELEALTR